MCFYIIADQRQVQLDNIHEKSHTSTIIYLHKHTSVLKSCGYYVRKYAAFPTNHLPVRLSENGTKKHPLFAGTVRECLCGTHHANGCFGLCLCTAQRKLYFRSGQLHRKINRPLPQWIKYSALYCFRISYTFRRPKPCSIVSCLLVAITSFSMQIGLLGLVTLRKSKGESFCV